MLQMRAAGFISSRERERRGGGGGGWQNGNRRKHGSINKLQPLGLHHPPSPLLCICLHHQWTLLFILLFTIIIMFYLCSERAPPVPLNVTAKFRDVGPFVKTASTAAPAPSLPSSPHPPPPPSCLRDALNNSVYMSILKQDWIRSTTVHNYFCDELKHYETTLYTHTQ